MIKKLFAGLLLLTSLGANAAYVEYTVDPSNLTGTGDPNGSGELTTLSFSNIEFDIPLYDGLLPLTKVELILTGLIETQLTVTAVGTDGASGTYTIEGDLTLSGGDDIINVNVVPFTALTFDLEQFESDTLLDTTDTKSTTVEITNSADLADYIASAPGETTTSYLSGTVFTQTRISGSYNTTPSDVGGDAGAYLVVRYYYDEPSTDIAEPETLAIFGAMLGFIGFANRKRLTK